MIRVNVDPTNPGQFFACCGLLELADRLLPGAEGWFEAKGQEFCVATEGPLKDLIGAFTQTRFLQVDPDDITASPIDIGTPFRPFRLDWWHDSRSGGRELKVWAGKMESVRIAEAMQYAMRIDERFKTSELFEVGLIAFEPGDPEKKVEPYYFDSRRGPNAHSRDVGFSPNDLGLTTTAFPAVELLCLVGLQRCRPAKTNQGRIYDYFTWTSPVLPELLPAVVTGQIRTAGSQGFRFENWFRTGQKKHKAFRSAIPHAPGV